MIEKLIVHEGRVKIAEVEEKPSSWYDDIYWAEKCYGGAACENPDYPLWVKVADKIALHERVMDLGCGPGQFASVLLSQGKKFVLGVDFSGIAIEKAWKLVPEGAFLQANVYDPSVYGKCKFDCVTLLETMEHIEGDLKVLEMIPPGTHVIFTVPNYVCASHVNAFHDEEHVIERYGGLLDIMQMDEYMKDPVNGWKVWIVDAIRRFDG